MRASTKHNPYGMTTPCACCPFRSDIAAYLTEERVREIEASLVSASFPCHKTTEHDDDGDCRWTGDEIHCAGALIILEKSGRSSQMMRIAERVGMYDRRKLNMAAPVFDTFDEMAEAQPQRPRRRRARHERREKGPQRTDETATPRTNSR